jgi:hypothetical protein
MNSSGPRKLTQAEIDNDPFISLLKNLQGDRPAKSRLAEKDTEMSPRKGGMTMDEMVKFRNQLSSCWSVLLGKKYTRRVDIKLVINPDRTLKEAKVIDMKRYKEDSVFRSTADGAINALRDPKCTPFNLPPDKYDQWKETFVVFELFSIR